MHDGSFMSYHYVIIIIVIFEVDFFLKLKWSNRQRFGSLLFYSFSHTSAICRVIWTLLVLLDRFSCLLFTYRLILLIVLCGFSITKIYRVIGRGWCRWIVIDVYCLSMD